jgi:folylpolyglutamate synthase/dihydropteroate synthase
MRDKALEPIAEQLFPRADKVILVSPASPRAAQPAELLKLALPYRDESSTFTAPSVPEGIEMARSLTSPDATILVTGSLYLVGEALAHLKTGD